MVLKEFFNPKAVSKLMGHVKEIITMDVYDDNKNIIADGVSEIEAYMKEVLPGSEAEKCFKQIVRDSSRCVTVSSRDCLKDNRTNVRHTLYFLKDLWYAIISACIAFYAICFI